MLVIKCENYYHSHNRHSITETYKSIWKCYRPRMSTCSSPPEPSTRLWVARQAPSALIKSCIFHIITKATSGIMAPVMVIKWTVITRVSYYPRFLKHENPHTLCYNFVAIHEYTFCFKIGLAKGICTFLFLSETKNPLVAAIWCVTSVCLVTSHNSGYQQI